MTPLILVIVLCVALLAGGYWRGVRSTGRQLETMTQERDVLHQLAAGLLMDDSAYPSNAVGDRQFRKDVVEATERALGYEHELES